ncbi:hypothetical protein TGAM01_v205886 [Trichoderma gamsii]|uniref:NWD NACHT-NTPase N-terminal domain-containing protein n=1 Tax=Trichoderma gamsii TaxID=398673 RepID=A0A2P4ZLN9_9HYPO|nr:hypothetical protein TGAM01_v205886 [Trichoderma gamsii]PON25201.1 hypothetical protein TGAM01_v205886 [Trichoderma gamsii]
MCTLLFTAPDKDHPKAVSVMASKLLCNFRLIPKLPKIFRFRKSSSKPQPQPEKKRASTLDSASEATDTSAANPPLTTKIFEPAAPIPETPNLLKVSLWDRAYDNLREKDKTLVEDYERILSRELPKDISPKNEYGNYDESLTQAENRIKNDDHKTRLTQLETITSNGLHKLDKKKARYYLFGCEFVVRDQFTQATRFIQTIKEVIDDAVKTSPEAALAWAGVCVILPVLMNPSVAEEATRDGYLYVTSRIRFYVKLEKLLSVGSKLQDSGLDIELEERLMTLYQLIIEFQIKIVRRIYLTRLKRLQEDAVRHENWKGMIAKIQESEKIFNDDFTLVKDIPMKTTLEELNCNTKELFMRIDAMMGSLLNATSHSAPALTFENEGSGNQFNATGGTQNNATGSGMQFSDVTFSGSVTF